MAPRKKTETPTTAPANFSFAKAFATTKSHANFSTPLAEWGNKKQDYIGLGVATLNILYSGRIGGGIPRGKISSLAAPSMTGKSFVSHGVSKRSQDKKMHVVMIDAEYAFDLDLGAKMGIDFDPEKFTFIQTNAIEEIMQTVTEFNSTVPKDRKWDVIYILDSMGTLTTNEAMGKAILGDDTKSFSIFQKRAELMNYFLYTQSTVFIINHTSTKLMAMGDNSHVPGGSKYLFNSTCLVQGYAKTTEGVGTGRAKEISGYIIPARNNKARGVVENQFLEYRIKVEGGLDPFYGLLPDALEAGVVISPTQGWYSRPAVAGDRKWRESEIYCAEFWGPILCDPEGAFDQFILNKYTYIGRTIDIAGDIFVNTDGTYTELAVDGGNIVDEIAC